MFLISFVFAGTNLTAVTFEEAKICINDSEKIMFTLKEQGFNFIRVNDTISKAKEILEIQLSLKEKGKNYNFSAVTFYCQEVFSIQKNAYDSQNELKVLIRFYNESFEEGIINTSSVDIILQEINDEIFSERYEKVFPLVDRTYSEIAEVKGKYTSLNLFYDSTRRGIFRFFENNWIWISFILFISLIVYVFFRKAIMRELLRGKLEKLDLRKKTLKNLLEKNQRAYFGKGNISENEFNIKNKKLSELIRDIDKDIPLLHEELAKLSKKNV
jgi:hypothetical protein